MANHKLLRLSATLLFIGVLLYVGLIFVHPHGAGNDQDTFTTFASSSSWVAIHLGQFAGLAVLLAGLIVLFFALNIAKGAAHWLALFGAIAAGAALTLAGVFSAVDGVALKQAVDAWVNAPASERVARFAAAEAIQSLELGTFSYLNLTFGLALILLAVSIVWTASVVRPIGVLMGLAGLALIAGGWLEGTSGFSATQSMVGALTYFVLLPALSIGMLIAAWRRPAPVRAGAARAAA